MTDAKWTPDGFEQDNWNHNPSRKPVALKPRPGWLLIQFPQPPTEGESRGGIALPGRKVREEGKTRSGMPDAEYPPNCARVFEAGEGCEAQPGEYVFFHMRVDDGRQAHWVKPQPLIPAWDPRDRRPSLWALKDAHVIATLPHAGDAVQLDVKGNVELLGLSGRWITDSGGNLRVGERFRAFDDAGKVVGVYVALTDASEVDEDHWRLMAAGYDGSEG